jgi:hypothetical protein
MRKEKVTKEEANEANVHYVWGGWPLLRPRISCQDGKSLRRVGNGRYGFQILAFFMTRLLNANIYQELSREEVADQQLRKERVTREPV